jgi:hypothetical protein
VQSHAEPHAAGGQRLLQIGGRLRCVSGGCEDDEEGIAVRIDLDSVVPCDALSN